MQQTCSSSRCLVTVPCHSGSHSPVPIHPALCSAQPGCPRPQSPTGWGNPCNPPVANLSSRSAGLKLSLTTSEGRKEGSHSSFTEVILTALPFLLLEVTGGEEAELHPMDHPYPGGCLAWGCIRAPVCDPGLHNTHTGKVFCSQPVRSGHETLGSCVLEDSRVERHSLGCGAVGSARRNILG